ncbi:MAG: phage tail tape measure protein, partial [Candidatus Alcyoniella australis]|nr:phage tail tape measure protein [Candidatus Alcyoniella australis]
MGSIFKIGFMISLMDKLSGPMANIKAKLSAFERFNHWAAQKFGSAWTRATAFAGSALTTFKTRLTLLRTEMGRLWGASKRLMLWAGLLAVPVVLVGKGFISFEDAAAKFRSTGVSVMGDMDRSMEMVQRRAIAFSNNNRQSATDYLSAAYTMVAATQDETAAVAGTDWALRMATATFADAETASDLLATAWLNMGDKTKPPREEFARLADEITKTQQTFKFTDLGAVAEGFKGVAGAAVSQNMSITQVLATLGQLNDVLGGAEAGTALKAALLRIAPAAKALGFEVERTASGGLDFIATLQNMHKKLGDTTKWTDATRESLVKAFGEEGYNAIVGLLPKLEGLADKFGDVTDAAGVTKGTVEDLNETLGAKIDVLKNRLTNLGNMLFGGENEGVGSAIDDISGFVLALQKLQEADPESFARYTNVFLGLIASLAGLAVLSGLIMVLLPVASALALIGGFIGAVGVAIAALVGLWIAVVYYSKKAAGSWEQFWQGLKEMFDPRAMLQQTWDFYVVVPFNQTKKDFEALILWFRGSGKRLWQKFKEGLTEGWGDVKTYFSDKLTWISGLFPHSEPKWGPLRGLMRAGETTMKMYAEGIRRGAADLARTTAGALALSAPRPALAAAGGGRQVTISVGDIVIHDRSGDSRDTAQRVTRAV